MYITQSAKCETRLCHTHVVEGVKHLTSSAVVGGVKYIFIKYILLFVLERDVQKSDNPLPCCHASTLWNTGIGVFRGYMCKKT